MAKPKFKAKIEFQRVDVGGTCINFPFTPYDIQVEYMKKVLECLDGGNNGLLESPTGTGKTLSLLCSSLGWLEKAKATAQVAKLQSYSSNGNNDGDINPALLVRHKVIYSSRTHSQLSQAVAELGRTSYRYMKVAILGSRDQLCVNPAVMEAPSTREKLHMCQARVKAKTCVYHTNVEKSKERSELRDNEIMDIEDLHKLGKKHSFCPYYMSRELYQTADVIFLPYNYLLDHKIRASLDIDFNGAIIIFDEAHNVQKLSEETASVSISSQDIAVAVKDIDEALEGLKSPSIGFDEAEVAPKELNEHELLYIKEQLLAVEKQFTSFLSDSDKVTRPGSFVMDLFQSFRSAGVAKALDVLVEYLNNSNASGVTIKGRGVSKLHEFLSVAFSEGVKESDLRELYKVHICKEEKRDGGKGLLKSKSENILLHLWCFSPGFSMNRLQKLGVRSIILTSGTLSPLQATAEEIGLEFPVHLENQHIVSSSQVWCGVLGTGPDGTKLNSSYNTRNDPKYLSALGQVVIMFLKIVPKGVLLFFPSYGLLNSTREHWQQSGIWSRIDSVKRIVVEPQRKDALSSTMNEYYDEIRSGRGACFMAVCRGKVAEGLDFADDNGRAVLITGLPYPPYKDARVELKRQFLDDQLRSKNGSMTGQKWYQLEAFRATNQAVGRVIRHSRDHGAVIFLDTRFGDITAKNCLSKWLQPHFSKYPNFGVASKSLASFFKVDSSIGQMRMMAVQKQTELMKQSKPKGIKRVHNSSDDSDDANVKPNTEILQDIYNVDCKQEQKCVASSIFAESSRGISFSCQEQIKSENTKNEEKVTVNIAPKKKKIKITSSKCVSFCDSADNSSNVSDQGTKPEVKLEQNLAKDYIRRLQNTLDKSNMVMFKSCIRDYKVKGSFEYLVPVLNAILHKQSKDGTLLEDFKVFVSAKHLSDFHLFCNVTGPEILRQKRLNSSVESPMSSQLNSQS